MNHQFYDSYLRLGGKSSFEEFEASMLLFEKIIVPAFCGDIASIDSEISNRIHEAAEINSISYRDAALKYWEKEIGNKIEADRIFCAVDSIAAVS